MMKTDAVPDEELQLEFGRRHASGLEKECHSHHAILDVRVDHQIPHLLTVEGVHRSSGDRKAISSLEAASMPRL